MRDSPLSNAESGLNLNPRGLPMTPEDKTDPRRGGSEGATTDPMFPPRIGASGPLPVTVSAVQGPVASSARAKEGSTEKLLTGLLENENDAYLYKVKSKDSAGENALAFDVSPRAVPVAHKTEDEPPVIVNDRHSATSPPGGALKAAHREPESTVPVGPRRSEKWVAFAFALLVVGIGGVLLVMWRNGQVPPTVGISPAATAQRYPDGDPMTPGEDPRTLGNATPPATGTPLDVTTDPVIESQRIQRTKATPPRVANGGTTAAAASPSAGAAPAPARPTGPLPPDFDELKKGIRH